MPEVVLGLGEVGAALVEVLDCDGHDPALGVYAAGRYDIVHVAIPWSESFVDDVAAYQAEFDADLVVIHSTVPPGTCDPHGWVHSPVRGRHPNLTDALRTFAKVFAGRDAEKASARWAESVGRSFWTELAVSTEIGKLWELLTFGVAIAVEKAIWEECERWGADWDIAYRAMSESYNEGWEMLGQDQYVKPVLDHIPGPIGGHCVRENMRLIDHPLARIVEAAGNHIDVT